MTGISEDLRLSGSRLVRYWTLATLIGELLGLGAAGGIGAVAAGALSGYRSPAAWTATVVISGGVGLLEGAVVGTAQWLILRRTRLAEIGARRWVIATAIGGALPWIIGMGAGTAGPEGGSPPSAAVMAAMAVAGGAIAGAMLGGCQAFALRHHASRVWRWAAANAAGWAIGLAIVMGATSFLDESSGAGIAMALGGTSGLMAGTLVGIVTGLLLKRILEEPPPEQALQSAAPPP